MGSTALVGKSCFSFDQVFGPEATQQEVFDSCVQPLVDATFEGFNGTLLAYGQTGSGKTYTMGTSGLPSVPDGALQRAIHALFDRAQARMDEGTAVRFRVSYVEIFTDTRPTASGKGTGCAEEIRDLLTPGRSHLFATLRADVDGQIRLDGVEEHEVWTAEEALRLLALGSVSRATCSTRMNDASSRSHAIYALEVVQRRVTGDAPVTLTAKFQFVDLAGSEKVKQSGAEGEQLSQAININHGLFVLGKAITALTDGNYHVPFRESKLTRLLQNSLGGNSQTCMIACVSPSDANIAETLSTLTYAAKAKEIRNKPVVNRGSTCPNCAALRTRIEALELRGDEACRLPSRSPFLRPECLHACSPDAEGQVARLQQENQALQAELAALRGSAGADHLQRVDCGDGGTGGDPTEVTLRKRAEAAAARSEALFRRCSERLAALQQAVRASELKVDEPLLQAGAALIGGEPEATGAPELFLDLQDFEEIALDAIEEADEDVAWLDQEARRKQRLLLQVEENHHNMAVLEQLSLERVRQHEAARDIAERELARLQAELDSARSRNEQLAVHQERYNQRLAALQERNAALEREQREMQRLKALQRQQETRLKVLQDSVRSVTEERDKLKEMLDGEVRRRREQEARGRKEKCAAREQIQTLHRKVAALERSASAYDSDASTSSLQLARRRSSLGSSSRGRGSPEAVRRRRPPRPPPEGPDPVAPCIPPEEKAPPTDGAGGLWVRLLDSASERERRAQQIRRAEADLEGARERALAAIAQRDRLSVQVEVEGPAADAAAALAAAEAEAEALSAALEYQQEQVWMLRRELEACPQVVLQDAAAKLAEGMEPTQLFEALQWFCADALRQRSGAQVAREAREAAEAAAAAARAALGECEHRALQQEQAFDLARSDYESRVAFLIRRLSGDGRLEAQDVRDVIGEDAVAFLTRRVAELEESLAQEKREAQDRRQRRFDQDMELIAACRSHESEIKRLRSQVVEAEAKAERAVARGAQKEAILVQQAAKLEAQLEEHRRAAEAEAAARPAAAGDGSTGGAAVAEGRCCGGPPAARPLEVSWGLELLEDFWRTTGLDEDREELLRTLRLDVEALCAARLQAHLQWKRELEERIDALRSEAKGIAESLREPVDEPPPGANLLQAARHLEGTVAALAALRSRRGSELEDLLAHLHELHARLYDGAPSALANVPGEHDADRLHLATLHKLRARVDALVEVEVERQAKVSARFAQLQDLWASLGMLVPDRLEPQEVALLQGPLPVSDSALAYLDRRIGWLLAWHKDLEREEGGLRDTLETWRERLAPFALSLPGVPADLPLLPRIEVARAAACDAEKVAEEFLSAERAQVYEFAEQSRLRSVRVVCQDLEGNEGLVPGLTVLARHWARLSLQRTEYRRLAELVASREALEAEMRDFDVEASDPNRFRRRGYSGVQENRRRAEHQRRLKALDTSISACAAEWLEREGVPFCLDGKEYRGSEILPPEHTHMYAWTGRQMAQKEALRSGAGGGAGGGAASPTGSSAATPPAFLPPPRSPPQPSHSASARPRGSQSGAPPLAGRRATYGGPSAPSKGKASPDSSPLASTSAGRTSFASGPPSPFGPRAASRDATAAAGKALARARAGSEAIQVRRRSLY